MDGRSVAVRLYLPAFGGTGFVDHRTPPHHPDDHPPDTGLPRPPEHVPALTRHLTTILPATTSRHGSTPPACHLVHVAGFRAPGLDRLWVSGGPRPGGGSRHGVASDIATRAAADEQRRPVADSYTTVRLRLPRHADVEGHLFVGELLVGLRVPVGDDLYARVDQVKAREEPGDFVS